MKPKLLLLLLTLFALGNTGMAQEKTPVETHGTLQAYAARLFDEHGNQVQLRGMSFFWSQWMGQYYTPETVKWLCEDWKCSVVRAAMGVEKGGYISNPDLEKAKLETVVQAAIDEGIYVIIDWHSHEAQKYTNEAVAFFGEMAQKYGQYPNIIYEIYNEPVNVGWSDVVKPYSETVIAEIRKYDQKNLILLGTTNYAQNVDESALDPIVGDPNVAYTVHYYSDTHKQWLRDKALFAMQKGLTIFISEFGTCDASGNNGFNPEESRIWWDFANEYGISWCNWSIADKEETASALKPGALDTGGWSESDLTESGKLVKAELLKAAEN